MKIGTSIWPWKWQPPYDETMQRIARAGFKAVELIAWDREALDQYYVPETIKTLRSIASHEDLEISEFVCTARGLSSPDKSERDASVEQFKRAVEVAVELGTQIINTVSVFPFGIPMPNITSLAHVQEFRANITPGLDWKKNWEDYVDAMRRCCSLCEDAGLKYALESHPYRWMSNAAAMLLLIEHVGSPALGMNMDPSHLFPVGELPEVVVYKVADRVFHCHFSDNAGVANEHWRVGTGKIDWKSTMQALKDVGFDGVISIELEDAPGGRDEHAPGEKRSEATSDFERENVASKDYIVDICRSLDIKVQ